MFFVWFLLFRFPEQFLVGIEHQPATARDTSTFMVQQIPAMLRKNKKESLDFVYCFSAHPSHFLESVKARSR